MPGVTPCHNAMLGVTRRAAACFMCMSDGFLPSGKSSVLKSLGGVSTVLTNIILATSPPTPGTEASRKLSNKEDAIVMDTKLKIIQILQVYMHYHLQYSFSIHIIICCVLYRFFQ